MLVMNPITIRNLLRKGFQVLGSVSMMVALIAPQYADAAILGLQTAIIGIDSI